MFTEQNENGERTAWKVAERKRGKFQHDTAKHFLRNVTKCEIVKLLRILFFIDIVEMKWILMCIELENQLNDAIL